MTDNKRDAEKPVQDLSEYHDTKALRSGSSKGKGKMDNSPEDDDPFGVAGRMQTSPASAINLLSRFENMMQNLIAAMPMQNPSSPISPAPATTSPMDTDDQAQVPKATLHPEIKEGIKKLQKLNRLCNIIRF